MKLTKRRDKLLALALILIDASNAEGIALRQEDIVKYLYDVIERDFSIG